MLHNHSLQIDIYLLTYLHTQYKCYRCWKSLPFVQYQITLLGVRGQCVCVWTTCFQRH